MKKIVFAVVTALCAGVLITGCGSSKQVTKPVSVTDSKEMAKKLNAPAEVEIVFPCEGIDSDEAFLRVNANGASKDRTMAKDRAYQNALANLASKLAGVMAMENSKVAVSVNADGEEFHDKMVTVSKLIAKANVSGYRTSCEKFTVNQQDGAYNCYVTVEFGKQKVVKQLYEALSNEKLLKADYDFDRYMKAFEKDLGEYEKTNK
jgi:isopropylmalate/homocitrate/citramalate synthase